jgi:hypothetical protein
MISPLFLSSLSEAAYRVLLVSGYDFTGSTERKRWDFAAFVHNRISRLRATYNEPIPLHVLMMDVERGKISLDRFDGESHTRVVVDQRPSLGAGSFRWCERTNREVFCGTDLETISITDVYDHVIDIGRLAPGTLLELNFVCHSWIGGPILVNSYERPEYKTGLNRDPFDKDGRANKDFVSISPHFADAFHSRGQTWNWGCANAKSVQIVLEALRNHEKRAFLDASDENPLTLYFGSVPDATQAIDTIFFADLRVCGSEHVLHTSPAALARFLRRRLAASYSYRLACSSSVVAYGALPGTYTTFDDGPLPMLHVPDGRVDASRDLSWVLDIYRLLTHIEFDPEGRGFARFQPQKDAMREFDAVASAAL